MTEDLLTALLNEVVGIQGVEPSLCVFLLQAPGIQQPSGSE